MQDYHEAVAAFNHDAVVAATLHGDLGALNACVECCDRHAIPGRIALFWKGQDGRREDWTYTDLARRAAQFADFLIEQGVAPGDRVAGLLPRIPELVITILATWRVGAVYQPLFTAFGPKAIEHRLRAGDARLVVTDPANRGKLDAIEGCPPVVTVGGNRGTGIRRGDFSFWAEVERQKGTARPVMRTGEDAFMLMFTSGTTGSAKPVPVPLKALVGMIGYLRIGVDLRPEDSYWNIADPGWAYGLFYAVAAPLAIGHPTLLYDGPFTAGSACRIIAEYEISNLCGAPTAYRLFLAAGSEAAGRIRGRLRVVSSAGEPLTPEIARWFADHLDAVVHDHYGQTETGIVLGRYHGLRHRDAAGSAGFPMPGYRVVVVDAQGNELPPATQGILAIDRARSPLFYFGGYPGQDGQPFVGDYYLSGDVVDGNADGSISFVGRADDVITSSGYRIGPFDVESTLNEHPAVLETAVVGKPDPERTEIVKAFVVLKGGGKPGPSLAEALQKHVRARLSAHAYPREIEFVDSLPKTPSGKVQRFILRQQARAGAAG